MTLRGARRKCKVFERPLSPRTPGFYGGLNRPPGCAVVSACRHNRQLPAQERHANARQAPKILRLLSLSLRRALT